MTCQKSELPCRLSLICEIRKILSVPRCTTSLTLFPTNGQFPNQNGSVSCPQSTNLLQLFQLPLLTNIFSNYSGMQLVMCNDIINLHVLKIKKLHSAYPVC